MFEQLIDTEDLSLFLQENGELLFNLSNATFDKLKSEQSDIEEFIMLQTTKIKVLDFSISTNKAFLLFLFDLSERLQLRNCIQQTYNWLQEYNVVIGSRLRAALLFNIDIPESSIYISRFNSICGLLETALLEEEDNDNKILATFANYYLAVLDRYYIWIQQLREIIQQNIDAYSFLNKQFISDLIAFDVTTPIVCSIEILQLKDKLFDRNLNAEIDALEINVLLIETDTDYSKELIAIPNDFDSIRSISVRHADGRNLTNRGVKILDSEEELYEYMRRFGNMHKAKLQSAFEPLPNSFPSKINIVDWGCGQGIASMIFIEKFGADIIHNITLIEPSELALKRAALHIRKYNQDNPIKTICKKLDELDESDFIGSQAEITVHLFSNILDIDDYSQSHLIDLIQSTQSNINYFVCASPFIDEIKTERLESFKRYFESNYDSFESLLGVNSSKNLNDVYWNCNNNFKGRQCFNHPDECGCSEKWTRVVKVFKVEL